MLKLLLIPALMISLNAQAAQISASFSKAKAKLYKQIYNNQGEAFYTGCAWSRKKVDLTSCGLQDSFPKSQSKRAKRTEAEHVIPASWMYRQNGKHRKCYLDAKERKKSARDYCQDSDSNYQKAHNDLVNLRPAVGAINGYRSNKPFAETLSGKKERTFRGNGKTVEISSRVIVPDPSIRGDIARIAFYMRDTYGVGYSKRQQAVFEQWHRDDPVSDEERRLDRLIRKAQGRGNFYVM